MRSFLTFSALDFPRTVRGLIPNRKFIRKDGRGRETSEKNLTFDSSSTLPYLMLLRKTRAENRSQPLCELSTLFYSSWHASPPSYHGGTKVIINKCSVQNRGGIPVFLGSIVGSDSYHISPPSKNVKQAQRHRHRRQRSALYMQVCTKTRYVCKVPHYCCVGDMVIRTKCDV